MAVCEIIQRNIFSRKRRYISYTHIYKYHFRTHTHIHSVHPQIDVSRSRRRAQPSDSRIDRGETRRRKREKQGIMRDSYRHTDISSLYALHGTRVYLCVYIFAYTQSHVRLPRLPPRQTNRRSPYPADRFAPATLPKHLGSCYSHLYDRPGPLST